MSIGHTGAVLPAAPTNREHNIGENRQHNSLVPINRLPNELLVIILSLFREDRWKKENYEWIKPILHVCSRWRNIGLSTPLLWSAITMLQRNISYIPAVLQRSRQVRLDAYLIIHELAIAEGLDGLSSQQVDRTLELAHDILGQRHRFRSLEVEIRDYFWQPDTVAQVSSKLKQLELTLSNCNVEDFDITTHWLFSSPLRSLQELTITSSSQLSGVLSLPNLRYLKFDAHNVDHGWRGSDLLEMLRGSPLLEELHINSGLAWSKVMNSEGIEVTPSLEPVHLPKLKTLSFCDRNCDPSSLLEHLVIPVEATLMLQYLLCDDHSVSNALKSLPHALNVPSSPKHPKRTKHRPLRLLKIRNDMHHEPYADAPFRSLHFAGCGHAEACTEDKDTQLCVLKNLEISFVYTDYTGFPWWTLAGFNEVLDLLPLPEVDVLCVEGRDAYNSLKQRLGLLSASQVPYATAPLCGVFCPGHAHGGEVEKLVELEPIQREFKGLRAVCMYSLPPWGMESTLEYEING